MVLSKNVISELIMEDYGKELVMLIYSNPEMLERLLTLPKYEAMLCYQSEMRRHKWRTSKHSDAQIGIYLCNTRNYLVISDFKMSKQQVILITGKVANDYTTMYNIYDRDFVTRHFRIPTNIGRKPGKIKLGSIMITKFKGKDCD